MQPNSDENTKPLSPCHCLNIRRASRAVTQLYDHVLTPIGLKVTQYSLLRNLQQVEPVNMNELAQKLRLDRTTLNRNLQPLIQAGFITVRAGEDLRSRQVMLTESGHAVLENALPFWNQAQASLEEYLGAADLAVFEKMLSRLENLA